jgi:two-component system nitrogen regulation sensor histidine kinase NtrY
VDQWFSQQIRTVVESAAAVGRAYLNTESQNVGAEVRLMAGDLGNAEAAEGLATDPAAYSLYLARQAEARMFALARVVNREGVLAQARSGGLGTPPAAPPLSAADFDDADARAASGQVTVRENTDSISALVRLPTYADAYLHVVRPLDPALISRLRVFSDTVQNYRVTEARQRRMRVMFWLSYCATTLLVMVAAIWLALGGASRIAAPIGRLADAARRVAGGDLSARVAVGRERDEIDALGLAFNGMTQQLESQHADLVKARVEAERRSRFTEAVLSGVSAGVLGLDRDERITAANRSAASLLGVAEGHLEGRRLVDVAPELSEQIGARSFQDHAEEPFGLVLHRGEGVAHLSVRIAKEADGHGLVITFDDMTKLVAAQRVEAWKDVARRIAHEIKNPLTPIQLSAERLRRKFGKEASDPETFERCTQTILRQVADIGRMVDEFSALARMPAPKPAEEDVLDLLQAAAYSQAIAFEDIEFPVETQGSGPFLLFCDGRLLAQAYTNVVKNAAEAIQGRRASEGEPKQGRVCTTLEFAPESVHIDIADNGPGFPQQNREKLIEPYVTTRAKGTGLGLAIVRRIVEDHGGELMLADNPGGGALVRIILPRRLAPRGPSELQEEAHVV